MYSVICLGWCKYAASYDTSAARKLRLSNVELLHQICQGEQIYSKSSRCDRKQAPRIDASMEFTPVQK